MGARFVALVAVTDIHPRTRHSEGLPEELGGSQPRQLPWPRVLVIRDGSDGVSLDRFTEAGKEAGDTWHFTIADAKEQAEDEYSGMLSDWASVPDSVSDGELLTFALASLS